MASVQGTKGRFLRQSRAVEIRTVARPLERRAVGVERRDVRRLIARAARPGGVAATVPEAHLMTHQYVAGAERVPVRAAARWFGLSTCRRWFGRAGSFVHRGSTNLIAGAMHAVVGKQRR